MNDTNQPCHPMRSVAILIFLAFVAPGFEQIAAQVNESDSTVLVQLYNQMDGPNWSENTGWLSEPVSNWYGITVEDGRVVEINLYNNNLTGELPAAIGQLGGLRVLSMYLNNISGSLPKELGNLSMLQELVVSKNSISGIVPEELNQLDSLRVLTLLDNDLQGPLPDLGRLKNLNDLVLDRNDFSGDFPEWILHLSRLRFIGLGYTGLSGEIPPGIFDSLPDLENLRIGSNPIGGDVAVWFTDSTKLNSLDAYNTNFTGIIPDGVLNPEINLFVFAQTEIEGIPDFSSATMPKSYFQIDNNKLGFHELEKALGVTTFNANNLKLGPQKPLLDTETIKMMEGDSIKIDSGSKSVNDTYQWYKDGVAIAGAKSRKLTISGYADSDEGEYYCIISNPDFEFDLQRNTVTLETDESTAVRDIQNPQMALFPNPASQYFNVKGAVVQHVIIYDNSGKQVLSQSALKDNYFDISALNPGFYLVNIEVVDKVYTKPLVVIK